MSDDDSVSVDGTEAKKKNLWASDSAYGYTRGSKNISRNLIYF